MSEQVTVTIEINELVRLKRIDAELHNRLEQLEQAYAFDTALSLEEPHGIPTCRTVRMNALRADIRLLRSIR
jgi:hypothetical protein